MHIHGYLLEHPHEAPAASHRETDGKGAAKRAYNFIRLIMKELLKFTNQILSIPEFCIRHGTRLVHREKI